MSRRLAALRGLVVAALLLSASFALAASLPIRPSVAGTHGSIPLRVDATPGAPTDTPVPASSSTPLTSNGEENYTIEKIFYGQGWLADSTTGVRRLVALLNLSEGYTRSYPGNGTFSAFTQAFIEFSIPGAADGPAGGPALQIRFSYYVSANCFQLNATACPLGSNTTAIRQDVFTLEILRILEYRDSNGNGSFEPGEPVAREVPLANPQAPFVRLWPFATNGSAMDLPYLWNVSSDTENVTMGALFAGDPLLDQLSHFWISVGNGVPVNLTLDSFLFLKPTTYKGIPLTPSELKLDLLLGVPSYAANDTAPALELSLTSDHFRLALNATNITEGVYASSGAAAAFFTWSGNATLDNGRSGAVGSTVGAKNETWETLYLAYPRATVIRHDPVLGLALAGTMPAPLAGPSPPRGGPQPPGGTGFGWALAATAAGLVVGASAYALLRRRRPRP